MPYKCLHGNPNSQNVAAGLASEVCCINARVYKLINSLTADNGEVTAQQMKKKKPLKERLAEKAEQRRKELEEKNKEVSY